MNDTSPNADPPPPAVDASGIAEIAEEVFVIPDRRVPLVPNIDLVGGRDAVLVVDTGMGPANGTRVLEAARDMARGRKLILTLTHFHPEHGFGAQAFKGNARITYNRVQRDELHAKGEAYLGMFRSFGPSVAAALERTELVMPDDVYDGDRTTIDLGGRLVELRTFGQAHTRGDQIVWLPAERILFTGDLAEERIFPIFPWFPPNDADLDGPHWAEVLTELEGWRPATVVPGHGAVGGAPILAAVRDYLADLGRRVAERRKAGDPADKIVAELAPLIRAEHPDWSSPEWIDFAIRYYSTLG
jgi:glyoxylase-like metal-dependent hydrolase (beta-lactamase superfamily II)